LSFSSDKEFQKLINEILKDKDINSLISKDFIERKAFYWFLKTYKDKKAESNFSSYILNEMQNSIEELKVHYSMLYLNISHPFQIGNVKFEFFTKAYFDSLVNNFRINNPEKLENPYESMRNDYQGKVYATYVVKAESEKAKEIALEQCSLAVDVLKMCSDTIDLPQARLSFDIDSRTKESIRNEVLLTRPKSIDPTFSINIYRLPTEHRITEQEWGRMKLRQIADFHNFLLSLKGENSELEKLILNGIKRYGNAISNSNIHQRVVELFTILESLLLPNKNTPIIDSVCKYCSKLVFKQPNNRKDIIELLRSMYDVRSSLIHHAKEITFPIDDLRKLQYTVIILLANLIKKCEKHKTKQSLLTEIDDAILSAY
jgi:hypothetical protein